MDEIFISKEIQNKIWINILSQVKNNLQALQSSTEKQFIQIGGRLGSFSQKASTISQDSLSVMELIAGKDSLKTIESISKKLSAIERLISSSITQLTEDVDILEKQKENFLQFSKPLKNLKKIIIQFNTLSLSIKIENTRLILDTNEFSLLADEVKSLSRNSIIKIEEIGTTGKSAVAIINQSICNIDDLTSNKYVSISRLLDLVNNNLELINEQNKTAIKISEEISGRFDENYNNINAIIINLQFHDIVRQKIEHVIHLIDELISDSAEGRMSEQSDPQEFALKIFVFCQLQIEQLKFARQEVLEAIDSIKTIFNRINQNIFTTRKKIQEMSAACSINQQTLIQQTGNNVGQISSTLYQTIDSNDNSVSTIKTVIGILNTISGHVADINTIGEDISLISFNGLIQTNHLGSEGVVLGAVISEIQDMLGRTQENVNTLKELLDGIDIYLEKLKLTANSDVDAGDSREGAGKITEELKSFFSSLDENSGKLNKDLVTLQQESVDFAQQLQTSVEEITVGDDFDFGLSKAIDRLNEIVNKIQSTFGDIDQSTVKEILEEHRKKYTMDKEREIHDMFVDGEAEVTANSEIGDNVELF